MSETIIVDQDDRQLATIPGAFLWPPVGTVVELTEPNRDAIVSDVRLQLVEGEATVVIRVEDRAELTGEEAQTPRHTTIHVPGRPAKRDPDARWGPGGPKVDGEEV